MIRLFSLLTVIFLGTACRPSAEQNDENHEQIMEGEDPILEEKETQEEDSLRNRDMMVILITTGSLEQTVR